MPYRDRRVNLHCASIHLQMESIVGTIQPRRSGGIYETVAHCGGVRRDHRGFVTVAICAVAFPSTTKSFKMAWRPAASLRTRTPHGRRQTGLLRRLEST